MGDRPSCHVAITGASSGLGAALARFFATESARLTLIGRDATRLGDVASACREKSADADALICDVADASKMLQLLEAADTKHPIDVVIANAGVGGQFVLAERTGENAATAKQIIDVNISGVVNTIVPLAGRFVERKHGHIVLIGSMAGYHGLPQSPLYSASKAAVRVYGDGLRRLLAPSNVKVTVVNAGFVQTPMAASLPVTPLFSWTADQAARRIAQGVKRGDRSIAFPWQFCAANIATRFLPTAAVDRLLGAGSKFMEYRR